MGLKRKQMLMRQKAEFEQKLEDRMSFLSGKGVVSPKAEKDTLARKFKANIKAVNIRLKMIAEDEKRTADVAKKKTERAAAPPKEQEGGKTEKSKKAAGEGKEKKTKTEKKAAPPKAPDGGKSQKPTEKPAVEVKADQ